MAKKDITPQIDGVKALQAKIKKFDFDPQKAPTGKVVTTSDGIALVEGLKDRHDGRNCRIPRKSYGCSSQP